MRSCGEVRRRIVLGSAFALCAACAPTYRCDDSQGHLCVDYLTGYTEAQASMLCGLSTMNVGQFSSSGPCAGAGRVATCTLTCGSGSTTTVARGTYYAPWWTADRVQLNCLPIAGLDCTFEFQRN